MSMAPVRLAIAGAGHMGARHATCIQLCTQAELTAVWSRTSAHAFALAAAHGAQVTETLEDLVRRADLDAVIIATPTAHHAQAALAAIRAGKHVIVEKPLARTLEQAEMLLSAAEKAGVLLLTGHVTRFFPSFRSLHEHVLAGDIGTPAVIHMSRVTATTLSGWRANPAEGGGVILDLGIHDLDWLLWTVGPVERVSTRATGGGSGRAHAYALSTIRFGNGAIAEVECSALGKEGFRTAGEIAGDRGLLAYDSDQDQALRTTIEPTGRANVDGLPTCYAGPSPFLLQMEHWVRCIRGIETPEVTPAQAYEALRLSLAALESAETGRTVRL